MHKVSKAERRAREMARMLSQDYPAEKINLYRMVGRDNWQVRRAVLGWNGGSLVCQYQNGSQINF